MNEIHRHSPDFPAFGRKWDQTPLTFICQRSARIGRVSIVKAGHLWVYERVWLSPSAKPYSFSLISVGRGLALPRRLLDFYIDGDLALQFVGESQIVGRRVQPVCSFFQRPGLAIRGQALEHSFD